MDLIIGNHMAPKIKIFLLVFSLISVGCSSEVDDFNNQSTKVNSSQLTGKPVSQDDMDLKERLQRKANNQELSENLENDLVFTEKESTHTGIESTARNTTSEESSTLSADATKEVISEEKGRITIDGADVSETDSVHDAYVEGGDAHRDDESKPLEVTFTDEDVNDKPLEGQLGSSDVAQRGIEKF